MAIAIMKGSESPVRKKSRLEMNVRQLLNKCELMAKQEPIDNNWRLKKFVESLIEMIAELKSAPEKPPKEILSDYIKRAEFLKGIVQTASLNTPAEKLEAVQQLPGGAGTGSGEAAREIHQKSIAHYESELRAQLFPQESSDENLRKRNILKMPNFTSYSGGGAGDEADSLLKHHQKVQEAVAESMAQLARNLKEQSEVAGKIVRQDTLALKKSTELTDRNMSSLQTESTRLQQHSRAAWKCWLWLMLAVVMAIFINMVLFMKVMKKRRYDEA